MFLEPRIVPEYWGCVEYKKVSISTLLEVGEGQVRLYQNSVNLSVSLR